MFSLENLGKGGSCTIELNITDNDAFCDLTKGVESQKKHNEMVFGEFFS